MTDPTHSLPERLRAAVEELLDDSPDHNRLADLIEEAAEDIESYDQSFDLRWKADMRAIKRWQEAHPGNDLVWPDHADLVVWLLEQRLVPNG
jgi:hypothetical protein